MATVKIVITGPESTGKSVLAQHLANAFHAESVPEYARDYFDQKGTTSYDLNDLALIAKGQSESVNLALRHNPPLLFCDTDLITIAIWARDKFNETIPAVENRMREELADLYLLCKPDLPWEPDPLREDGHRREALFNEHKTILDALHARYVEIEGQGDQRTTQAIRAVQAFLDERT